MPALHDRPQKLQERIFTRLFEAANIAQFSPTERTEYEDSLKVCRDLKNSLDTAMEKGREEGRAEGRAQGLEEGRIEGALQRAQEIAKNLTLRGIDVEQVAQVTGLPLEEVRALGKR